MAVVNFLWDDTNLLEEFSDAGAAVAHYVTEPDQYGNVLSQRRSGQSSYFHYEAVGSTTEVSDATGSVTDTRRYTAFGETVEETGMTEFPVQFVGRIGYFRDKELASTYVRRRQYRRSSGQWLSLDPLWPKNSFNSAYVYVDANPINWLDPSGLEKCDCAEATVAIDSVKKACSGVTSEMIKHNKDKIGKALIGMLRRLPGRYTSIPMFIADMPRLVLMYAVFGGSTNKLTAFECTAAGNIVLHYERGREKGRKDVKSETPITIRCPVEGTAFSKWEDRELGTACEVFNMLDAMLLACTAAKSK